MFDEGNCLPLSIHSQRISMRIIDESATFDRAEPFLDFTDIRSHRIVVVEKFPTSSRIVAEPETPHVPLLHEQLVAVDDVILQLSPRPGRNSQENCGDSANFKEFTKLGPPPSQPVLDGLDDCIRACVIA